MIDGLKPYPAMKDSGVQWLGAVPGHWDVRRIKTLLNEVDNRSPYGEERLLSLRMRQGLIDHVEAGGKRIPPDALVGFKIIEPGQIVMNRMRAAVGLFGVANMRGLVSPDYAVFEPKACAHAAYLLYTFRLPSLATVFRAQSKGLGTGESGFLRLYTDRFGPIQVPYPPLEEQRLIVRFLDWHGRQTAKLIRAKKKLVAQLNEQKQAVIHRAVTRGLDPNVRLKPSGIEWLGDVPEHWDIRPAKFIFRETDERSSTGREELLSVSHITGVTPRRLKNVTMFMAESYVGHKLCRPGDLVVNTMWAWMAALGVARQVGIVSPGYGVYRPLANSPLVPEYADLVLRSKPYVSEYNCRSTGIQSSRLRLYPDEFLRVKLACPPPQEQESIVRYLDMATAGVTRAVTAGNREIELLNEHRSRLIADVVTGKLDVREAAARLPDETYDLDPHDEDAGEAEQFADEPNDAAAEEAA